MKIFKEEVDYRRERNRHSRFGGWFGLLIKIVIVIILYIVIKGFAGDNITNFFNFFGAQSTSSENVIIEKDR
ncbi:MAG: hypothetical protein PHY08_04985 [Candidatus Cloacimonetes bacterium]|nr:hypothetical protein [Candidatus Cloacimonadota bacterium]MDD4155909.1 hypothetical protein [Candidatus Cloacimonadota bacterium]